MSEKRLKHIFAGITAIGAIISVVVYFENKKINEVKHDIAVLDREIKALQLEKLKNGN